MAENNRPVKKKKRLSKKFTRKLISVVLVSLAIAIFINIGKTVYTMYSLKKQSDLVEEELTALQDENAALDATKTKLEDNGYVTTYARGAYMFSKGDEKVFYLPSGDNNTDVGEEASSN